MLLEASASSHLAFLLVCWGIACSGSVLLGGVRWVDDVEEVLVCGFHCNLILNHLLQFSSHGETLLGILGIDVVVIGLLKINLTGRIRNGISGTWQFVIRVNSGEFIGDSLVIRDFVG